MATVDGVWRGAGLVSRRDLDRALVALLVVSHGVLDAVVTVWPLARHETTVFESNPLVGELLIAGYWLGVETAVPMWLVAGAIALGMTAVVAGVGVVAWRLRDGLPAWRAFVGALAAAGVANVGVNLLVLSTCSCS
jgi:hypothetical protein